MTADRYAQHAKSRDALLSERFDSTALLEQLARRAGAHETRLDDVQLVTQNARIDCDEPGVRALAWS